MESRGEKAFCDAVIEACVYIYGAVELNRIMAALKEYARRQKETRKKTGRVKPSKTPHIPPYNRQKGREK